MKLYEILDALSSQEFIDFETGEVDLEMLNQIQMSADEKIENIACMIKNFKSDANELKAEENNLKERRERLEKKVDGLTKYLTYAMTELNRDKFSSSKVEVGFRKSKAVEIESLEMLDRNYIKEKIEYSADKKALKEALEQGIEIAGATLVERRNISVK